MFAIRHMQGALFNTQHMQSLGHTQQAISCLLHLKPRFHLIEGEGEEREEKGSLEMLYLILLLGTVEQKRLNFLS